MPETVFVLISRAVVVSNGQILLCQAHNESHAFLPGGHIEHNESARDALQRELMEELHTHSTIGEFIAAVEHTFNYGMRHYHELNLVFKADLPDLSVGNNPTSYEQQVGFYWQPIGQLDRVNFQPSPLVDIIRNYIKGQSWERFVSTIGYDP
ncbi:MAG: NUDIX domain-containing protein [candidate division Zixibacteria bacterium]|nr:NUDIX domain-containing protein [candidate division Zixibacteria bacterium]